MIVINTFLTWASKPKVAQIGLASYPTIVPLLLHSSVQRGMHTDAEPARYDDGVSFTSLNATATKANHSERGGARDTGDDREICSSTWVSAR